MGKWVVAFVVLFSPALASASGLFLPARFARNQAMGGTGIAVAGDITVLAENPAGMVAVTSTSLFLNYHLYKLANSFQRYGYDGKQIDKDAFPPTENTAGFFNHIPNIFAGSNFGVKGLMVAGGVWSPIGPRHVYDPYGPQRYSMVFNQIQLLYTGVSAAYQIVPQLSLGGTFMFAHAMAEQHIGLMILPEASSLDGLVILKAMGLFKPMGIVGATLTPYKGLHIGMSYQTAVKMELEGTVEAEVPVITGRGKTYGKDDVVASQKIPDVIQFGVGWKAEKWAAEFTTKFYRWSQYKELNVDLATGKIGDFTLADFAIQKKNSDALSFHLGGSYLVHPMHELRAGAYYDQSAIDPDYVSITEFDSDKIGLTGGYAFHWKGLTLAATVMHMLYQEVETTNSQLKPIQAFEIGDPPRIGDGVYLWKVTTLGGSVSYDF